MNIGETANRNPKSSPALLKREHARHFILSRIDSDQKADLPAEQLQRLVRMRRQRDATISAAQNKRGGKGCSVNDHVALGSIYRLFWIGPVRRNGYAELDRASCPLAFGAAAYHRASRQDFACTAIVFLDGLNDLGWPK